MVVEQPFKIPFVAAVVMVLNTLKEEMVMQLLERTIKDLNKSIIKGDWRQVKLYMKFLGSLQGLLEGDGVFTILQDFLTKALDLQTENNEEVSDLYNEIVFRDRLANIEVFRPSDLNWSRLFFLLFHISWHLQRQMLMRRLRL